MLRKHAVEIIVTGPAAAGETADRGLRGSALGVSLAVPCAQREPQVMVRTAGQKPVSEGLVMETKTFPRLLLSAPCQKTKAEKAVFLGICQRSCAAGLSLTAISLMDMSEVATVKA